MKTVGTVCLIVACNPVSLWAQSSQQNAGLNGPYKITAKAAPNTPLAIGQSDKLLRAGPSGGGESTFFVTPLSGGDYEIRVGRSEGRRLHENGLVDKLISTRWAVTDDYTKFRLTKLRDGSYMVTTKATGRYWHFNGLADKLISTRWQTRSQHGDHYYSFNFEKIAQTTANRPLIYDHTERVKNSTQSAGLHLVVSPTLGRNQYNQRYIHIDMNGSVFHAGRSGSQVGKTKFDRGYYLESLRTSIKVLSPKVQLARMAVFTEGDSGKVTSSVTNTNGVEGGISLDGPSGTTSMEQATTFTHERDLKGFAAAASDTGRDKSGRSNVRNIYKLKGVYQYGSSGDGGLKSYAEWKDLVDFPKDSADQFRESFLGVFSGKTFQQINLHTPPDRAKSGFPIITQAGFVVNDENLATVNVRVAVTYTLRRVTTKPIKLDKLNESYVKTDSYVGQVIRELTVNLR